MAEIFLSPPDDEKYSSDLLFVQATIFANFQAARRF